MFYLLIGSDILMAIMFVLRLSSLPPQIPLFFSKHWGEGQLADSWMIVTIPLFMNALFLLNNAIYKRYFQDNNFVMTVFEYLNIFVCLSFTFIFIRIIFLVT